MRAWCYWSLRKAEDPENVVDRSIPPKTTQSVEMDDNVQGRVHEEELRIIEGDELATYAMIPIVLQPRDLE